MEELQFLFNLPLLRSEAGGSLIFFLLHKQISRPNVAFFEDSRNLLQASFIRLAKDEHLWQGDLHGALRNITSTLADVLMLGRASVWLLDPTHRHLNCNLLFRTDSASFEAGLSIATCDIPDLLRQLDDERIVTIEDAQQDPRLTSLRENYLIPHGIGAIIGATLNEGSRLSGVLFLEQLAEPRHWSRKELEFVRSVADLLSQLLVFHALRDSERGYHMLFDAAGDAIFTVQEGRIIDCNPRSATLFGREREQLLTQAMDELSPPYQPDGQRSSHKMEAFVSASASGPQVFEWTHQRADGSLFEAEVSLSSMWFAGVCRVMAIVRDITERRRTEIILRDSASQLERRNRVLQVIGDLASRLHRTTDTRLIAEETLKALQILQRSPLSLFHFINRQTGEFDLLAGIGYTPAQLEARRIMPLGSSLSAHALASRQILRCPDVATDDRIDHSIREMMLADGIRSMTVLPLLYQSEPLGVIGLQFYEQSDDSSEFGLETLRAICETVSLALANARNIQVLEYQAMHDSLTGLPNRALLHRATADALRINSGQRGLALLLLDLDRFKEVNDTLGHRTGDLLLRLVATRLQAALTSHNALLSRLGGDEFAILLRDCPNAEAATTIATGLVNSLHQPLEVEGIFIELGGSIGVAVYPQHGGTSHALLRCADVAMYAAKSQSIGVSLYDNTYDAQNPRRLAMITDLGTAIRRDQLKVYYQPRYDLQSRQWRGCEALLRWQHPTLGFIPPMEFVQFAETSDLIRPLTLLVARHAIRQLHEWQQQGLNVAVSVNLSTRNLLDVTLPDGLAALLDEYGVSPSSLELEITETALMTDPDRAMQVVERIAELGMALSIDDFGTGYSSLAYLKRLPLHALKIDRSFVMDMLDDEQDAIIVRSTIGLAHSLGLRVVAEGVETASTLEKLREFGCDEAQGYVLGKPLPPEQAFALMRYQSEETLLRPKA